jgi:hypothetical protein
LPSGTAHRPAVAIVSAVSSRCSGAAGFAHTGGEHAVCARGVTVEKKAVIARKHATTAAWECIGAVSEGAVSGCLDIARFWVAHTGGEHSVCARCVTDENISVIALKHATTAAWECIGAVSEGAVGRCLDTALSWRRRKRRWRRRGRRRRGGRRRGRWRRRGRRRRRRRGLEVFATLVLQLFSAIISRRRPPASSSSSSLLLLLTVARYLLEAINSAAG